MTRLKLFSLAVMALLFLSLSGYVVGFGMVWAGDSFGWAVMAVGIVMQWLCLRLGKRFERVRGWKQ